MDYRMRQMLRVWKAGTELGVVVIEARSKSLFV